MAGKKVIKKGLKKQAQPASKPKLETEKPVFKQKTKSGKAKRPCSLCDDSIKPGDKVFRKAENEHFECGAALKAASEYAARKKVPLGFNQT